MTGMSRAHVQLGRDSSAKAVRGSLSMLDIARRPVWSKGGDQGDSGAREPVRQ